MPKLAAEELTKRKQHILNAAARCFSEKGYYHATMRDVLAEAQLSSGAVYHYFPSKETILSALAQADSEAVAERVRANDTRADLKKLIRLFFGDIQQVQAQQLGIMMLSVASQAAVDPQLQEQVKRQRQHIKAALVDFLQTYYTARKLFLSPRQVRARAE
ncbi:MAG TPA: TetR/AcrR family transcriptional regulator, partial [Pseudidiomarina sp.]|nr:TetR/AcrR family transcriptional regulator [Pseudidiomarina sp.]